MRIFSSTPFQHYQGPEAYTWGLSLAKTQCHGWVSRYQCVRVLVEQTRAQEVLTSLRSSSTRGVRVVMAVHCLNERHGTSRSDSPHKQMFKTSCAFSQHKYRQSNKIEALHGYTILCRSTRRIAHDVSCARRNPQWRNCLLFLKTSAPVGRPESRIKRDDQRHHGELCTLQVSHSCVNSHNSLPRPHSCSRDIEDGLRGNN